MRYHRSRELKEMLLEGVLSIAIRADFWQHHAEKRKKSGIDQNIGRQRAVFDRMNIQISKQWHTTMSRPFYSDANKAKNVSVFFFFFFLLLFVTLFYFHAISQKVLQIQI